MNDDTRTTIDTAFKVRAFELHQGTSEDLHALSAFASELAELYGTPERLDQRQATLWDKVARDTGAAARKLEELYMMFEQVLEQDR